MGSANIDSDNERLPTELGWSAKKDPVTQEAVMGVSAMISKAASLITESGSDAAAHKRRGDLHAGLGF